MFDIIRNIYMLKLQMECSGIRNGVVVGLCRVGDKCGPVIGNRVDIGAGAKAAGNILLGDNVLICENTAVLCDVSDNSVAVGVPAVAKPRRMDAGSVDPIPSKSERPIS